jgi:hypothetical protein
MVNLLSFVFYFKEKENPAGRPANAFFFVQAATKRKQKAFLAEGISLAGFP